MRAVPEYGYFAWLNLYKARSSASQIELPRDSTHNGESQPRSNYFHGHWYTGGPVFGDVLDGLSVPRKAKVHQLWSRGSGATTRGTPKNSGRAENSIGRQGE
jgi:hypothetical protein